MTQKLQENLWEKVGVNMNDIVIKHNGIEYTREDIIQMIDLVLEIIGEES